MLFPVFRFHSVYEPVPEWLSHRYRDLLVQCYNVKWPTIKVSVLYRALSHANLALAILGSSISITLCKSKLDLKASLECSAS